MRDPEGGSWGPYPLSPRHERRVSYSKISECVLKTEIGATEGSFINIYELKVYYKIMYGYNAHEVSSPEITVASIVRRS